MSKTNRNLLVAVAVLFLLSVLTWRQTVGRADRFQRGQLFLPNLNPDEIATIELAKGEEKATLRRQGDGFIVVEKRGYPASNSSVNKLLRDLLEIGLEREIGKGESLAAELGIEPPQPETVELALLSTADKEMVRLRVGNAGDEVSGNAIQRLDVEDEPIYLTARGVFLSADPGSYLEKEIVDHPASEVVRIEGPDFELQRPDEGGDLELLGLPPGREVKSGEVNRLAAVLSGLRYDNVFVADDPEVAALVFEPALTVHLQDGSSYVLSRAEADERFFLRILGRNEVQQVAITIDESEEELREKAEQLSRADEIDAFNEFHGSWVYEVSSFTAEKLKLRRAGLVEASGD